MPDDLPEKVDESEFLEMSRDPAQARLLRKSLEQIARSGTDGALPEMVREVLSGRVGLRDAVNISAYSDRLLEDVRKFKIFVWKPPIWTALPSSSGGPGTMRAEPPRTPRTPSSRGR
ncbi:hypothetical protein [Streptomyces sp. NPDC101150]|uniref:hypothetical protein n=1 Tax=Streptomyces sp. NPDC101150 TaxID=3366114 RepID=UPI00380F7027